MKLFSRTLIVASLFWSTPVLPAATNEGTLDFQEVYELLRANLAGATSESLNRAAAQGLLTQLKPRVAIVAEAAAPVGPTNPPTVTSGTVFDGAYGYVRIGHVGPGLGSQFATAYQGLAETNRLKGLVLDLRFAGGTDYAAAAAMADGFFSKEQPLLDWGEGMKKSSAKSDAIELPLAVLLNGQTAGAAEALAAILRQADIGLLLGTNTAGQAGLFKEFKLKTGQRLRVATAALKGRDGQPLPLTGLKPDIHVDVSEEAEQAYFEDAYKVLPKASRWSGRIGAATNEVSLSVTNRPPRRRPTEADLVRMHREGQEFDPDSFTDAESRERGPTRPVITDPALARAIDLLKGLAVIRQFRSI
jgi:hypothetical protein